MPTQCFLLIETGRCRRWFRRFCDGTCPLSPGQYSYHDNSVLGEDGLLIKYIEHGRKLIACQQFKADDAHWPKACKCGFVFPEGTEKQTFFVQIYLTPDGREVTTHDSKLEGIERAPAGAMWYADWLEDCWPGPDGKTLMVRTPGGGWCIDGPASNGGRPWKRTGVPPNITVTPSINIEGKYHGFLQNGQLTDDLERR